MRKKSIYVHIAGYGGHGKTHTACTAFPKAFLIDCTLGGDGDNTAMKVFGEEEFDDRYFHAQTLEEVVEVVDKVIEEGKYCTVVFDEYGGLKNLGREWYLRNFKNKDGTPKKSVMPSTEWQHYNNIFRGMVRKLRNNKINIVVTSRFDPVYNAEGHITDKVKSVSPPNVDTEADFRCKFVVIPPKKEGEKNTRVLSIIKNKSRRVEELPKIISADITWEDIKAEFKLADGLEYVE